MKDPGQHALVIKAITSGLSNCLFWKNAETESRIRGNRELQGLTPREIKKEIIEFVKQGGDVEQVAETREPYRHEHVFYYKIIMTIEEFSLPLFVEMVLHDADPDVPMVCIVNAHLQRD
jgi:hypothetical protein